MLFLYTSLLRQHLKLPTPNLRWQRVYYIYMSIKLTFKYYNIQFLMFKDSKMSFNIYLSYINVVVLSQVRRSRRRVIYIAMRSQTDKPSSQLCRGVICRTKLSGEEEVTPEENVVASE